MSVKREMRRTPEVTYTFEGEEGKYVRLEDYTHDVLAFVESLSAETQRRQAAEAAIDAVLVRDDAGYIACRSYRRLYPKESAT